MTVDDRIIDEDGFKKDITSGIDIDISAEMKQDESKKITSDGENEEKEQTIVFQKPVSTGDASEKGSEVSFRSGKKP